MSIKIMQEKRIKQIIKIVIGMVLIMAMHKAKADTFFNTSYQLNGSTYWNKVTCTNTTKVCVETGTKIVQGVRVQPTEKCWRYQFVKTCPYPSSNNCHLFAHCYFVADRKCLAFNTLGNCLNMQKEFSCKSWDPVNKVNQTVRVDLVEKDGPETIVCSGIPCIDGNCVDKSYLTDGDMMDSLSRLYTVASAKGVDPDKVKFFAGNSRKCSKFPWSYLNCCREKSSGWGRHITAKCSTAEVELAKQRHNNLCVFIGKSSKKLVAGEKVSRQHYCCFKNILDKVIQIEGRKQLPQRNNFGTPSAPDCDGFTVDEIRQIDWSKVDFAEFINDIRERIFAKANSVDKDKIKNYAKELFAAHTFTEASDNEYDGTNNYSGWKKEHQTKEQESRLDPEEKARRDRAEQERQREASLVFEEERLQEAEREAAAHQADTTRVNGQTYGTSQSQIYNGGAHYPPQRTKTVKKQQFWNRYNNR